MSVSDFKDFPWLQPWQPISKQGREAYRLELELELTPSHPLYDQHFTPIARTCDGDDILVELRGTACRFVVVHLTFTGRPEPDSRWPRSIFFRDVDDWIMRCMIPDLARFEKTRSQDAA
jgi:hypothetical protein